MTRPAAKVLTVSDGVFHGSRDDTGGRGLVAHLAANGFEVVAHEVVADGSDVVAESLVAMCAGFAGLVVTTGGTGFAPRVQTPAGTATLIERAPPGLRGAMRAISPHGRLSRGVSGIRGRAIVCNLPGSPTGAIEQLSAVLDVVPHALVLLAGEPTTH